MRQKFDPTTSQNEIEVIERLSWSWTKSSLNLAVGAVGGFIFGSTIGLAVWRPITINFGVAFGFTGGLIAGLLGGLTGREVDKKKPRPNQGIYQSAKNAILTGLPTSIAAGLPLGIVSGWAWGIFPYRVEAVLVGIIVGITMGGASGFIIALFFGGLTVIQHSILRFILWWNGHLPWNLAHFLDYCTDLIFLRKVGGGYIFIHRLLLEHFATMNEERSH